MRILVLVAVLAGCGGRQAPEERPAETECRAVAEHYVRLSQEAQGGPPDRALFLIVDEECREVYTRADYRCVRLARTLQAANACFGR